MNAQIWNLLCPESSVFGSRFPIFSPVFGDSRPETPEERALTSYRAASSSSFSSALTGFCGRASSSCLWSWTFLDIGYRSATAICITDQPNRIEAAL